MQADQVSDLLKEVAERLIMPRFGALDTADVSEKQPGDLVTVAAAALPAAEAAAVLPAGDGTGNDGGEL